jgi:dTDP-glucose pyrophosphorylase
MRTWGVIPAAGAGSRIQPLAFSKELLPVGSRLDGATERPRAVSEYLVDRMLLAGVTRLCLVISPGKSDIIEYYGGEYAGGDGRGPAQICYAVQPHPSGLCDALFRALPFVGDDDVICAGLPDTVWFPEHGLRLLPDDRLSFLCFPVAQPELFDAVVSDGDGRVRAFEVKVRAPSSRWIWGAFKAPGRVLRELHELWRQGDPPDEYLGTLVNTYLSRGGAATAVRAGEAYVDVGTLDGYREALRLLGGRP